MWGSDVFSDVCCVSVGCFLLMFDYLCECRVLFVVVLLLLFLLLRMLFACCCADDCWRKVVGSNPTLYAGASRG